MEPQIPDLILLSTPDGLTATRPDSPTETSHPGAHSAEHGCWMEEQAALVSPGTSTSSIRPPSSSIQQSVPFSTFDEKQGSLSLLDSSMNLGVMNRRKSTFVSLDSHTPMMSRKRSMRSCMSELEALAAQRRRQVPIIPKHTRSARIDLMAANIQNEFGICGWILTGLSYILIFFTMPISLCMCIKVVQEYERAVIFRLGRLMPGGAKGPGIFFIVPCIDTYRKVDLRVLSFEVPPQEILSKDSVTVAVDAVVYFRISNATISVTNVEDASRSTKLLAQTTLRNILGTKTLAEMLSDREAISLQIQATLDDATEPWGVKVERVEVKDIRLPVQLQRAMAAEAEAAREARAKVIVAEGEQKASKALKEAAEVIAESPSALQLRYLQTLNSISAEKNSTIIFPLPIDLLSSFLHRPAPKTPETPTSARRIRSCCVHKYPDWVQNMATSSSSVREQKSMRDSSYQQSASGFDDSSSNIPLSGRGIKSETRASSNLLKTALANRIQPRLPQSDQQLKDRSFNGVETYLRSQQPNGFLQGNRRQITTPQRESRLPPPSAISYNLSRVSRTTSESAVPISSILERRDSSQSDSSRGSNVPKSVTFNDKVEINEIERKYDDEGMDSINPHFEFINETLLNNGGKMQTEKNNESLNPMRNLLQPIREGLRSSPSLNLDLVYDETRERPDWMSDEEWMMLQSMYVPSRETSKDPSPPLRLPTVEDYPKQEVADELAAPSPPPLPDPSTFIPIPLKVEEDQVDLDPANNSSGGRLVNEERKCFEDREIQAKPPANQILNLDSLPVSLAFSNPTISQRSPMSPQTSRSPLGFSKVGVQNSNSENDALSCAQQLPQPPLRSSSSPLRSPQMSSLKSTLTKPSAPSLPRSPSTNSSVTPPSSKIFASRAFSPANRAFSASRSSPSSPTREVHQQPLSRQMPGSLNRLETQDSAFLSNTRQTRYLGTNQNMLVYPHSEGPSTSQNLLKNSTNSSNINTLNSHSYQSIDSSNDPVNRTTTSPSSLSVSPTGRYNSLNSPTRSLPNSKDPIGSGHEQRSSPLSINAINSPSTNSSPVRRPTHLPPMPKPVGMTRPAQSKPKLKSPLDLATSFYDNVDAEQQIQFQHKFLQQFGRHPAPIASPEEAARLNRKNSLDSNFSSDSRESVVSATSLKAEARIRRFFNY